MVKELLLAKSNLKKKKGISIGVGILMLIATVLIGISLLLFLDAYPSTSKYSKKLNSGDGYTIIYNDLNLIDNDTVESLVKEETSEYEISDCYFIPTKSIEYGNGDITVGILLTDYSILQRKMNATEIVIEDEKYTSNYIYLPYKFYSAGGYKVGDNYSLKFMDKTYELHIKGFLNNTFFGDFNAGPIEIILDDETYNDIKIKSPTEYQGKAFSYNVKDGVNVNKLNLKISNEINKINNKSICTNGTIDSTISNRGFMSLIIAVSFLTVTFILSIILILMLANSISNYIKESMKEIGALKAIGYTSKNIVRSIVLQFVGISVASGIIGVGLSYCLMPLISSMVTSQSGFPYSVSFNAFATLIPFIYIIFFTFLVVLASTAKIKRIEPIVALKDGVAAHNFKKNRVPMDKFKFGLNSNLALKTLFNNLRQGVITFVVTGFLVFVCTLALLMFENFNRNPKLDILTFEICSGVVSVDREVKDDAYNYLVSRDDTSNVRKMINSQIIYGDNVDSLLAYIIDDADKLNNKNICYKGKLPHYDNEIAVSGKFATAYKLAIGDEVEMSGPLSTSKYIITGFLQTCNNGGREALLNESAAGKIIDIESAPGFFWFDSNKQDVETIINDFMTRYGDNYLSSINFYSTIDGAMRGFKTIASLMLVVISVISMLIILLVLYLLIKTLIHNKRKEYGILKAMGYKSKDLMLQTTLSFMPPIILSVILFSFASYYLANPYMSIIMINFGLMKCTFSIPLGGMFIIGIAIVLVSFAFALLETRKIKNIEPYSLLTNE